MGKNPPASNGDADTENRLEATGGGGWGEKERVGGLERVAWKHIHYRMQQSQPMEISYMTQGTQIKAL